ncbi:MAG: hypothetical protein KAT90_05155 [Gammaproteobacteria bacterium]|nr:hypothetical protein [Gammaproteobacteria bacterium]
MPDYLTLVKQLQRECGVAGAAISTVTSQTGMYNKLVQWIADADEHLQSLHIDWKFLWSEYSETTVIGIAEPAIPADLNIWDRDSFYLNYSLASNKRLVYKEYKDWRNLMGRGVQTNRKPTNIVIKPNNQIILAKPPDDAYALTAEYWATPTKMVDNIDVSAIPAAFHRIIVLQAKLWYAEEQDMPDVYAIAKKELRGDGLRGKDMGLLGRLESLQLPNQEGRTMGEAPDITIRAE